MAKLRIQPAMMDTLIGKLENSEERSSSQPPAPLVTIGTALPALLKKLIARVLANEHIDFPDLPQQRARAGPMPQSHEGQVITVQAAELLLARKITPDLATWTQLALVLSIYAAALCAKYPTRLPK